MLPVRYAPLYFCTVLVLFFILNYCGNATGFIKVDLSPVVMVVMALVLTAIKFLLLPWLLSFTEGRGGKNDG